jgi:predicted DNA-binding protein (UPF0251 family)
VANYYLNQKEAAEFLGISVNTFKSKFKNDLPAINGRGRQILFKREDIEALANETITPINQSRINELLIGV